MIAEWETNTVLIADDFARRHPEIVRSLDAVLREHDVTLGTIAGMADVWIRDAAPVQVDADKFVQFRYRPDYLCGHEHLITKPEVFRNALQFESSDESEIVLDGGNVVGVSSRAVLTDKVFRENPQWNRSDLREALRRSLGVDRLIVIPKEPYDAIGHSDGMLRFLGEDQVLLNDYRPIEPKFANRLESVMATNGLRIVRFPYLPNHEVRDGIASAVGNYVNFLRVGYLVLLPAYGLPADDAARAILSEQLPEGRIVSIPCRALAKEGGVLNCATWTGRSNL